jgi:hypothetical protein
MGKRRRRKRPARPAQAAPVDPSANYASLRDDLLAFGLFALFCLAFLLGSAPEYFAVSSSAAEMRHEIVTLPDAHGQPAGTRAVLSGTIAPDTKPLFRHFVAFIKEGYRSGGRGQRSFWAPEAGGLIQQLRLIDGAKEGWIENTTYEFSPSIGKFFIGPGREVHPRWDHMQARDGEVEGGSQAYTRYRGFVVGGAVTAVGTVTPDGFLDAEYEVAAALAEIASGRTEPVLYWCMMIGLVALGVVIALFCRSRWRAARTV